MSRDRSRSPNTRRIRTDDTRFSNRHDRRPYDRDGRPHDRDRPRYTDRDERNSRVSRDEYRGRDKLDYRDDRGRVGSREDWRRQRDSSRDRQRPSYRPVKEDCDVQATNSTAPTHGRATLRSPSVVSGVKDDNDAAILSDRAALVSESYDQEDADAQIAAMMGMNGFGTTKGQKVLGNAKGGVAKAAKKVEYRQYMNRPGGFNRELSPS